MGAGGNLETADGQGLTGMGGGQGRQGVGMRGVGRGIWGKGMGTGREDGAHCRVRTCDPLRVKQMLYH